jgi:hypothetical protein
MERVGDILRRIEVSQRSPGEIDFDKPIKYASDCIECPDCGEPWCEECECHYADCSCPGPQSEPEET